MRSLLSFLNSSYEVNTKDTRVAIVAYNYNESWTVCNDIETPDKSNSCFETAIGNLSLRNDSSAPLSCKLPDALSRAEGVFPIGPVRSDARRIAWIFSDCDQCAISKGENQSNFISQTAAVIRGGMALKETRNVTVFAVGISECSGGYFNTIDKENLLRSVASSNDSHFACITAWNSFLISNS